MAKLARLEKKWWILIAMICSYGMIFIDQTAIPVALPFMQKELNASSLMLDWIVNAYLLTLGALTILGGKIGDLYGHRKAFLYGIFLFIFSSVIIGFAPSVFWAIVGRALQGVGGAFMVPAMTVIVTNQFNPQERGRIVGLLVGIAAIFASIGPLLGGALTQYITWRAVFWINIPLAFMSILVTLSMVPEELYNRQDMHLDWQGALTLLITLFAFIFCLMEIPILGFDSIFIFPVFLIGFFNLCLFIWIELNKSYPLIDLSLFKYRQITIPVIIFALNQVAFISSVFWVIFFQNILNASPTQAGMMLIPFMAPLIFMPALGGGLRDHYGAKLPIALGTACAVIGIGWIALFAYKQYYLLLMPGLFIAGSSAPLIFSSAMTTAMQSVEINKRGLVSGMCAAARQIGSSAGLALLGSLMIDLNQSHLNLYLQNSPSPLQHLQASQLEGLLSGAMQAKELISRLPSYVIQEIYSVTIRSHIFAFTRMMAIVFILCVIMFLLSLQLPSRDNEIEKD